MGQRITILVFITILLLVVACSEKSTEPENPLDKIIAGVSLGSDTLIADMTQPLIVSFVTMMNEESVENAFSCSPQFGYEPHWTIETSFDPTDPEDVSTNHRFYLFHNEPFVPGITYTCEIDTTAFADNGNNLPIPFEFQFTTSPAMLKGMALEYDGVDTNRTFPHTIRLTFNTAIDLNTIQRPFSINPEFEYELTGISRQKHIFEYKIMTPLMAKTDYHIDFSGDIFDIWGNQIDADTGFAFGTGPIKVVYCFPTPGFNLKSKRPIIQVRFNTIMDKQSVETAFRFGAGTGSIPGTFYWLSDKAVQFFYNQDLLRGEPYTVFVDTTATDIYGTPLNTAFSYTFIY